MLHVFAANFDADTLRPRVPPGPTRDALQGQAETPRPTAGRQVSQSKGQTRCTDHTSARDSQTLGLDCIAACKKTSSSACSASSAAAAAESNLRSNSSEPGAPADPGLPTGDSRPCRCMRANGQLQRSRRWARARIRQVTPADRRIPGAGHKAGPLHPLPDRGLRYRDIDDRAEITYRTSDATLLVVIHAWFDAQVSDHGTDPVRGHEHGQARMP